MLVKFTYKFNSFLFGIILLFNLASCTPIYHHEGHKLDSEVIKSIKPGFDNKKTILKKFGSASTKGAFNKLTWIYISKETEKKSFYPSNTISQKVLSITFNEDGFVKSVNQYELEDGKLVKPSKRSTPSMGKKMGLFEQLFGNLGRINPTR